MGSLTIPASSLVYVDTQSIIYTVEGHPKYESVLQSFWADVKNASLAAATSTLTLMEVLILPIRQADAALQRDYECILTESDIQLLPLSPDTMREAARLRALTPSLRTPDAIHAAAALLNGCTHIITNDAAFRRIPQLITLVLDDFLA